MAQTLFGIFRKGQKVSETIPVFVAIEGRDETISFPLRGHFPVIGDSIEVYREGAADPTHLKITGRSFSGATGRIAWMSAELSL